MRRGAHARPARRASNCAGADCWMARPTHKHNIGCCSLRVASSCYLSSNAPPHVPRSAPQCPVQRLVQCPAQRPSTRPAQCPARCLPRSPARPERNPSPALSRQRPNARRARPPIQNMKLCWARARVGIARLTLMIELDKVGHIHGIFVENLQHWATPGKFI